MRRAIAGFALLVVSVAATVVVIADEDSGFDGGGGLAAGLAVAPEVVPAQRPPEPTTYVAADAVGPRVALFESAGAETPMFQLPNPTHEGMPLVFHIERREGDRLLARLPMRPNGSRAWIDAGEVAVREVPHAIDVDVSDRTLSVRRGEEVVWETLVAVGAADTPTPIGDFYVDISVPNPGSSYGAYMLSIAGYSDVLLEFDGGIGQIAAHGWSDPSVVGRAVSNGCLRMPNDAILRLAQYAPTGTPVSIRA